LFICQTTAINEKASVASLDKFVLTYSQTS
jgi:hypothetical protein